MCALSLSFVLCSLVPETLVVGTAETVWHENLAGVLFRGWQIFPFAGTTGFNFREFGFSQTLLLGANFRGSRFFTYGTCI